MAFKYNINTSKKDNLSSTSLFIIRRLKAVTNLFLSTFLVAYIYSFSGDIVSYIKNVAIFEMSAYIVLGIFYLLLSPLVDRTNRVWIYRIGLILRSCLVLFAVFFGQKIASLLFLAGGLKGLSDAFYYTSYNVITHEMVSRRSISKYVSLNSAVNEFINVVLPIAMGSLIEISTYSTVAIYVAVVCALQVFFSFFIRAHRPENSHFSLKEYHSSLKQKPHVQKKMRLVYIGGLLYGSQTIVDSLINICIMWQLGSNLKLGILTSIFSIVSALSILCFSRFTKPGKRNIVYFLFAIASPVATMVFAWKIGLVTLIIYSAMIAIVRVVFKSVFEVLRNANLKEDDSYDYIAEHQAVMDTSYNITRVITYAIMLLIGVFANFATFQIFLCVMSLSYTGLMAMLIVYEKRYFPDPAKADERAYKIIMKTIKQK